MNLPNCLSTLSTLLAGSLECGLQEGSASQTRSRLGMDAPVHTSGAFRSMVVLEIFTMAKAAGNGHPLGFVITTRSMWV